MAPEPGLANRALWPLLDGLRAMNHDAAAALHSAGIQESALRDPEGRVPHSIVMRLWHGLVEASGDCDLGLHLAERANVASFDLLGYLMAASATLGDAYRRLCRYQRLIHESTTAELVVDGHAARLRHSLPGGRAAPRQPAEFLLAAWLRAGRLVTGTPWRPEAVCLAHRKPPQVAEHLRIFGVMPRFGQAHNELVFSSRLLDTTSSKADPGLLALLSRYADDALSRVPVSPGWSERIRKVLNAELRGGNPAAANVAARLGMSARTMQRRLAEAGLTYSGLVENLRRELAMKYLGDKRLSSLEIAFLLGYSDAAAFQRAFKRWTGDTPARFRAQTPDK